MFPTSHQHREHKGAIYLNNVGCSLLELGAFQDALETFRDSVAVMKTVCTSAGPPTTTAVQDASPNLLQCIQRADQRLAFPQPLKTHQPQHFGLLMLEDYHKFEFDTHLLHHPHHTLICPVRVNDVPQIDPDLDSATMLFNLGLSYACVAKCQTVSSHRDELKAAAARVFDLADSILHHTHNQACNDKACNRPTFDDERLRLIAMVNIAVLHSLLQVMVTSSIDNSVSFVLEENDNDICHHVLNRLYCLQHTVYLNELEELCPMMGHLPAAAA